MMHLAHCFLRKLVPLFCSGLLAATPAAVASNTDLGEISVMGTQGPTPSLPVTVISAQQLQAWGAIDLADVLSLVVGATPARGGDGGPEALMPGLVGAREADDYLLVVDGVPQGATTAPPFESVSLTGVERIEVRRGPDPVIFGSAAFAGAIYIYHYGAGKAPDSASASVGSYGSHGLDAAISLPSLGALDESLSATVSHQGYSDPRGKSDRYQLLYRASAPAGDGVLGLDAGLLDLQQTPLSPTPVTDQGLSTAVPTDSNQNPAGARINEYRSQLSLDYVLPLGGGTWSSTAALTHVSSPVLQGFLGEDDDDATPGTNASGFSQDRRLNEAYLDSHWQRAWAADFSLSVGINDMYGNGAAHSTAFDYLAPMSGATPSPSSEQADDRSYAADTRNFFGVYTQIHWRFAPDWLLDVGLRENVTDEDRRSSDDDSDHDDDDDATRQAQRNSRLSSSAMLSWEALDIGADSVTPYIAYADAFQPSQFDFSPDPDDAAFLAPETARSWQLGVRGVLGALDWELSSARVDFGNAVVAEQVHGLPSFVNGGSDYFRDVDLELELRVSERLRVRFSYEYVEARYLDYNALTDDGDNQQLAGNRLPLTPVSTADFGVVYGGSEGFNASASVEYRGSRYLDPENQLSAQAFVSYDCKLGYGFDGWSVYLSGENLTDRRDPLAASEIGDGQVYRMQGRRLTLGVTEEF
ncbi:MAG TPA: TonB-dependent receptor [Gammaproteobacteria bacterium]